MKVLHVDSGREWRGGQTQLLHLVRGQPGDVHVALPADAPLRPALEQAGVAVHPVELRGPFRGTAALARVIADVAPDLVAAHTSHAHGHALLAARGRPVVVHRRVDFVPGRDPVTRLKYRAPRGYVAVSAAVARILEGAGVPKDAIAVVHDGVDPEPLVVAPDARADVRRELGVGEGTALIGAVGALVAHKGHRHLVDAMTEIGDRGAVCVIAGDGELRADLEARIERLRAPVRLLGARGDVPRLLAALDLFVHPSVEEGMGQAVVEAMIAGVPVVSTSAGGLAEVIDDMETGLLVAPGDGSALARAIVAALRGRERAMERAAKAKEAALKRFSVKAMVDGTLEAYQRFARV